MAKSLIRNTVRKLRFQHSEMTQQQLAEKVGVTRRQSSRSKGTNIHRLWSWLFALPGFSDSAPWRRFFAMNPAGPEGGESSQSLVHSVVRALQFTPEFFRRHLRRPAWPLCP